MGITLKRISIYSFLSTVLACSLPAQTNMLSKTGTMRWGPVIGGQEAQQISADVTGMKTLTLLATGYSYGQAVWGEAVLVAKDGSTTNLASIKPRDVQVAWGDYMVNKGPDGKPLIIAGKRMKHGLFAHADSCVVFPLNGRYVRFEARIGINDTAGKAGNVVFEIGDQDLVDWRRTMEQFRHGFTPESISGLRKDLKEARKAGGSPAAKAREYEKHLDQYEKMGDEIRKKMGAEPEAIKEQITGFTALVRDIHFLKLDTPLLFVKRHAYFSPHIYDDYATWHPGGGIYIIENPSAPVEQQVVRAVIDPKTAETLGEGVYRDPDLSYDARKILFAFKGEEKGDTSIYEIGLDGKGLRRVTNPGHDVQCMKKPDGLWGEGQHDISPCYLPDGRIAFISTRASGLVMCFNNFSATLHTINPDGTDLKCLSVNNVTEFDPSVLPDGRILFGRWEYVDKTALYMQSLWVANPDGSGETAVFKNNIAKPTAVLDARNVPGTELIVASLTPHNGQSVGAIAMIDPRVGKNNLAAITNFTPEYPTEMDQGLTRGPSDPWPVSENIVLISDNAQIHGPHGVLQMIDRYGFRTTIRKEGDISCFSPMLVKPTKVPPVKTSMIKQGEPAKFLVHDIYDGMPGIKKGEVKQLRVLEPTTRLSGVPPGGRWWNQALLISWQGSYDIKRFIGVVPVEEDGSAYFEAPPGKALYMQALDKDGRLIQSMRTFVQAVPGVTRSCRGCHLKDETKAPVNAGRGALALKNEAVKIAPESWGNGCLDYPTMVQPVLDRNCVKCHGGEKGMAGGLDFSGGWTWAFSISYETLLKNTLTGFLNCNNGNVKTSEILDPRTHGSGAGLLGKIAISSHSSPEGMSRKDIDLLLAWMDGNCNYHGIADYTEHATCGAILALKAPLVAEMEKAGCVTCHQPQIGNDWINLQNPERSRILRAPLVKAETGLGLAWCRDRKAKQIHFPLVDQGIQPPDVFKPYREPAPDTTGSAITPFADTNAPVYIAMLAIIEKGREEALKTLRVDMPGAQPKKGKFRDLPPLGSTIEALKVEYPLRVRVLNFVVNPSTGPVGGVVVKNSSSDAYVGTMRLQFPAGWKVAPSQFDVGLASGEEKKFNFTVEKATDVEANSYPVGVVFEGPAGKFSVEQKIVCASAPYFKPRIDGQLDEWKDSIPITFMTGGRKTVAKAYWNNRQFCLAVEVDEDQLIGLADVTKHGFMDAVQFALSPAGTVADKTGKAGRYEFLAVSSGSMWSADKCYLLTGAGEAADARRPLKGLEVKGAEIVVKRSGTITRYELSIPFAIMPEIKPAPGREICFGLLVHDPDGVGPRDMGASMNMWEERRNPQVWHSWEGVKWNGKVPYDGMTEFGFCSSIH